MRSLRSRTLIVIVALLTSSVAALLPLLHVHSAPTGTAPIVVVHLPGDGHVHVAVRDYGHADTWEDRAPHPARPVPLSPSEPQTCPACLAALQTVASLAGHLHAARWPAPPQDDWLAPPRHDWSSARHRIAPFDARGPPVS